MICTQETGQGAHGKSRVNRSLRSQMSSRILLLMIHMEHSTKSCSLAGFALKLVKFIREDFTHSKRRSRNNTAWPKKRSVFVACVPICTPTCTIFRKQLPTGSLRGSRDSQLCGETHHWLQVLRDAMRYSYQFC